ncbi:MAG: enoyl-CoA hydratase/isomerase family protein, partial [Syntrophomonadaceae bacterium]|nr:enoyl-CoA hydratase/isomerase family protein [Syntrophomonadaceae bacterium]
CSGADLGNLDEWRKSPIELRKWQSRYANLLIALNKVGKPTIAAVQGYALAGGCGLAVACDLTISSDTGVFGIPEITRGIWGMMITPTISRAIGPKKSLELMYTGKFIKADEAERIGLINTVVSNDRFEQEVQELANSIAERSPLTLSMGREAFYNCRDMEYFKSMDYLREIVTLLVASDDVHEGITAFQEKRKPIWQGK